MRCYKCNSELSPTRNRCSKCGTDVRLYRRLCRSSNVYYNNGLDKAKVRDLTGAVAALKMSLSLDKTNIDARNLLGLVYFEMGEAAMALREWVISSNMLDYDNDAIYFLQMIQGNPNKLDIISESIKKYNFSLKYAGEDGEDLAIIQLKKVIQTNPNLLRAYQLLALLYIHQKQYRKAESVLKKCLKIDRGNTTARRYMQEIRQQSKKEGKALAITKPNAVKTKTEEDDFEADQVIIPVYTKSFSSYFVTALDILIGLALGILIVYFVIIPGVKNKYAARFQEQLTSYQTSVSADKVTIAELNDTVSNLEEERDDLKKELAMIETADASDSSDGEDASDKDSLTSKERKQYNAMINLLIAKIDRDAEIDIAENASVLDIDDSYSEEMQKAYSYVMELYGDESEEYYNTAYAAYEEAEKLNAESDDSAMDRYSEAITYFESCISLNPDYGEAYLWLGVCEHHLGQIAKAKSHYEYFLENYSDLNESLTNVAQTQLESIE